MKHTYLTAALIFVVCIGVVLFTYYDKEGAVRINADAGMYSYVCEDGAAFSMTPSEDMSSVHVVPGAGAAFPETSLAQKDAQTYGTADVTLVGAGEHIRIMSAGRTYECDPVPNATDAPFNWGDPAEGAGPTQSVSAAVRENIVGLWRSKEDPQFTREFKADSAEIDRYEGDESATQAGTWSVTENDPVGIDIKSGAETLNFVIVKLTAEELEMTYTARGNTLRFSRVQ